MRLLRVITVASGIMLLLAGCGSSTPSSKAPPLPKISVGTAYNKKTFVATGTTEPIKSRSAWACYQASPPVKFKTVTITITQKGTNGTYGPWAQKTAKWPKNQVSGCLSMLNFIPGGFRVAFTAGGKVLAQEDFTIQVPTTELTVGTGYNSKTFAATGTQQPLPSGTLLFCYALSGPMVTPNVTVSISQKSSNGSLSSWGSSNETIAPGEQGFCVKAGTFTQGSYQVSVQDANTVLATKPFTVQ